MSQKSKILFFSLLLMSGIHALRPFKGGHHGYDSYHQRPYMSMKERKLKEMATIIESSKNINEIVPTFKTNMENAGEERSKAIQRLTDLQNPGPGVIVAEHELQQAEDRVAETTLDYEVAKKIYTNARNFQALILEEKVLSGYVHLG